METQKKTPPQEAKEIFTFSRGEREQVRGAVKKYKGKYYFDLRVWFHVENTSTYYPSKKGLFLGLEHLEDLQKGLEKLAKMTVKVRTQAPQKEEMIEI